MKNSRTRTAWRALLGLSFVLLDAALGHAQDDAPMASEQQLPRQMRSAMNEKPTLRVGRSEGAILATDHRGLQAAVDYVAALGGGVVEIGPGEYTMRDSLHLRPGVTVRGVAGHTLLRKAPAVESALAVDGDFGEEQITVKDPAGFDVGCGVAVWSGRVGGFHVTVARIIGRSGNRLALDKPLNSDTLVRDGARAATVFPVVSGYDLEGARVEGLVIEGNRKENPLIDGCRGAGIYLYRGFGTVIRDCIVRDYHGDGIGFQQSNDVVVEDCLIEGNANLGLHPGSGSQRAVVRRCTARNNGADGLFLCWRVRHSVFEDNVLEGNGRFGISIGHKDSDNVLQRNEVLANAEDGIYFRDEPEGMAGHRNVVADNLVENNGRDKAAAGIRVRGETRDVVLRNNRIRDTRAPEARRQKVGIQIDRTVGAVVLDGNQIEAPTPLQDERQAKAGAAGR